jgi:hypothetical protein
MIECTPTWRKKNRGVAGCSADAARAEVVSAVIERSGI